MKKINTNKVPIYRDSGFNLGSPEKTVDAFKAESEHPQEPEQYIYSRYRNPTVVAIEKQIQGTNPDEWCLLFQSGMAAIETAISVFQESNDSRPGLFFTEIYGGTNSLISTVLLRRRNSSIVRFSPDGDNYSIEKYIQILESDKPKFVYFETVSNPMLIVADCLQIINEAKKRNIYTIVDNTFATSFLWDPIINGADLVVESATKYISGHGNISAGIIRGMDKHLLSEAIEYRKWVGHMISPDDAYRLGSQYMTFNLRIKQQVETANKLAHFLEKHKNIEKVRYPGLKSHPTHDLASCLFKDKGFGAIITFQLSGKNDTIKRENSQNFISVLSEHFELIPSLGDCQTIFMPVDAVWGDKYPFPGTIRLSVGIEEYHYIEGIITNALNILPN